MTRLFHAADLHQGVVTHSRPDPRTGIPSRVLDVHRAWAAAVDQAIERRCGAAILAGDLFHDAAPDPTSLALFARELRRLSAVADVLIVAGNHDRAPHAGRPSVLEVFATADSIQVATEPGLFEVGDLLVAAVPSVSIHQLRASTEAMGRVQAQHELVDGLRAVTRAIDASSDQIDCLTLHWPIAGAMLSAEKDLSVIPEPMLDLADVEGQWRYIAAGHIHKAQPLHESARGLKWNDPAPGETPWSDGIAGAYPGSIERMTFGEEGQPKGCVVVDMDGYVDPMAEFVTLPAREFVTLDFARKDLDADVDQASRDPRGLGARVHDAIVRVRNVPADQVAEIRRLILDAGAHLVYVHKLIERPQPRAPQIATAPDPVAMLRQWIELADVDTEIRGDVLAEGTTLIETLGSR